MYLPTRHGLRCTQSKTSLQGLHIIDFDEKKIYANPEITSALQSMKTATLDNVMPLSKHGKTNKEKNRPSANCPS